MNKAAIASSDATDSLLLGALAAGIDLVAVDDALRLIGPTDVRDQWRERLRTAKPALLERLRSNFKTHSTVELREAAGDDWPWIVGDPAKLSAFADMIALRRMRERGEAPAHYTAVTCCRQCGVVPIFPGGPDRVEGCPWCFNRVRRLPYPRA